MTMSHKEYSLNYYLKIDTTFIYVDNINSRLKIIDHHNLTENAIINIINIASTKNLGKIICFCDKEYIEPLKNCGFVVEGHINGFFKGNNAICLSYFVDINRRVSKKEITEEIILKESLLVKGYYKLKQSFDYCIRNACEKDIPQMITLFKEVFETYPSPVNNAEYLREVMNKRVLFKVAQENDKIIGIASADMDISNLNAEITDCATQPNYRGRGILPNLIESLEKDLKERGFITLYSLSRAINKGINKTLSKLGYEYNGRLINNCHICGNYEDMNIWTKSLKNQD